MKLESCSKDAKPVQWFAENGNMAYKNINHDDPVWWEDGLTVLLG